MATGYQADSVSRYGRTIRPTDKVKELISNSLKKEFKKTIKKVERKNDSIFNLMKSHPDYVDLKTEYRVWSSLCRDLLEVESEYSRTLEPSYKKSHELEFFKFLQVVEMLKADLGDALRMLKEEQTTKENLNKLIEEEERLRKEISQVEVELSRISVDDTNKQRQLMASSPKSGNVSRSASTNNLSKTPPILGMSGSLAHEKAKYSDHVYALLMDDSSSDEEEDIKVSPKIETLHDNSLPVMTVSTPIVSTPVTTTPVQVDRNDTHSLLEKLADLLQSKQDQLPNIEPKKFSGDLLEYPEWWASFESRVEKRAKNEEECLFFLGRYTQGVAHESIKGILALHQDPDAYRKAKSMLENMYGDKCKISDAFKRKLYLWPVIKKGDGEGLQKFANFLWQCYSAMSTIQYLDNLNSKEENHKLVKKLPNHLADRWDRKVDSAMYRESPDQTSVVHTPKGDYPTLLTFCKFLSSEARVLCNGSGVSRNEEEKTDRTDKGEKHGYHKKKHTTFQSGSSVKPEEQKKEKSDVAPSSYKCIFCSKNHFLSQCIELLEQPFEEKREFLKTRGVCFGCFRKGHRYHDCKIRNHDLMKDHKDGVPIERKETASTMRIVTNPCSYTTMIFPVMMYHRSDPSLQIKVYALIDTQSDCCFIQQSLIDRLDLPSQGVNLELTTMGSTCTVKSAQVFDLAIKGVGETEELLLPKCYARDEIPADRSGIPDPKLVRKWSHLESVARQLQEVDEEIEVGMLIGFNCPETMLQTDYVYSKKNQPFAVRTMLGWSVFGNFKKERRESKQLCFSTAVREVTAGDIKKVFELESSCLDDDETKTSRNDMKFMKLMEEEVVQREDGHIELPLPIKDEMSKVPNNRYQAMKRLLQLKRRFDKDAVLHQRYTEFMKTTLEKGHAEEVPYDELKNEDMVWYWAHQGVYHPRKPDKLRVVMDGGLEFEGFSLNSFLMSGPDLTNSIVGVLVRFREEKVAIVCDIEGMFHQVKVTNRHRNLLRFLWFEDGNTDGAIKEYRMTVHVFGATSSPGCANFALKHVADRYANKYGADVADFIKRHFYVDDGLGCKPTVKDALSLMQNSHQLCKEGGFNLHKYASTNKEVLAKIPRELRAKEVKDWELASHQNLPTEKTLGMGLDMENDSFRFTVEILMQPDTRRGMLSSLSTVYDPLGLVGAALLEGRNLLQKLCNKEFTWDEKVPFDMQKQWNEWHNQLVDLNTLQIPRCIRKQVQLPLTNVQLHTFCDASQTGYGVCVYLRLYDGRSVDCSLLVAKSKVLPMKQITIPRSELRAAVLGVQVATSIKKELTYPDIKTHFWSDSKVVLGYLANSEKRFHLYVTNRICYIRERTSMDQWHYVKTDQNPADIASRGLTAKELVNSQMWWNGPSMLHEKDEEVKMQGVAEENLQDFTKMIDDADPEVRKQVKCMKTAVKKEARGINLLDRLKRFSCWQKVIRIISIWREYFKRLQEKAGKRVLREDAIEERKISETKLIRLIQLEEFPVEYRTLSKVGEYPKDRDDIKERNENLKESSNLYKLDAFLSKDGCLRVGGRIKRADIPREMAQPVLLPNKNKMTDALIRYLHDKCFHAGRGISHSHIRASGYWIVGARSAIDKVIHTCTICRILRGCMMQQKMSDLPVDRLEPSPPFTYCAADFFGPFQVKQGRSLHKRWACVFIDQVLRAAHVEVVHTMSTDSFLQAYRRFVCKRGPIRQLRCDRGTNFVGAESELRRALMEMDVTRIKEQLKEENCDMIEFKFNAPKSSNMGGAWERPIRTLKSTLMCLLTQHGEIMNDEMLITFMAEAESIFNNRPISFLDGTSPDTGLPLSPNQLLTMKHQALLPPPGMFENSEEYSKKRWRRTQFLANQFWNLWRKRVLPEMQKREKWQIEKDEILIDDIVLISDPQLPRNKWEKARVVTLLPDEDKRVRKVELITRSTKLVRPINKLVMLHRAERKEADEFERSNLPSLDVSERSNLPSPASNERSNLPSHKKSGRRQSPRLIKKTQSQDD